MGIIGKTHGVSNDRAPIAAASHRNDPNAAAGSTLAFAGAGGALPWPFAIAVCPVTPVASARSTVPVGTTSAIRDRELPIVALVPGCFAAIWRGTNRWAVCGGRHVVSLQV